MLVCEPCIVQNRKRPPHATGGRRPLDAITILSLNSMASLVSWLPGNISTRSMLTLLGSNPKAWILLINSATWLQETPIPSLFSGCTPTALHRTVVRYAKLCSNRYSMSLFISASRPSPLDPLLQATNSLSLSTCFCSIFAGWDLWKFMFMDFTPFGFFLAWICICHSIALLVCRHNTQLGFLLAFNCLSSKQFILKYNTMEADE